jgi:hypothetical protein
MFSPPSGHHGGPNNQNKIKTFQFYLDKEWSLQRQKLLTWSSLNNARPDYDFLGFLD